ncbi:MAG TPA: hypothetical protein VGB89_00845 [Bacteroidota bacterium]
MKTIFLIIVSAGIFTLTSSAQTKNATIIGEVIDVVSYMTSGAKANSPDGMEILRASAAGGNPLGILEAKTGKIYLVTMRQANTPAKETLLQYLGQRIAAKGDVYKKGGSSVLVLTVIGKSIK